MFCYNCVLLGRNNTNDSHRTHAVEETFSAILRVKLCNSVIQDMDWAYSLRLTRASFAQNVLDHVNHTNNSH